MDPTEGTTIPFADYLAAKFALDERSLNPEVRSAFWSVLRALPRIECIDAGAGTGATIRRLLAGSLTQPLSLTALDSDPALLELARDSTVTQLRALGVEVSIEGGAIRTDGAWHTAFRFAAEELKSHRPDRACNVITAHALLDIVPLAPALASFAGWLAPGGYLYATINYDGETELSEPYEDRKFESRLLDYYNYTMEIRRVDGQATGGAYCGRRLAELLPECGFTVLAGGRSDWDMTPLLHRYRDDDAVCLTALLGMILAEGQKSGQFRPEALERWHADRRRLVQESRLAMRVHHTDVLARYDP
jgi:SAM-dependent methyltransferase